ncbi:unnamed protein product [Clonostachys solani]|uniref:Zn(2)-C6 fungal-type domain-containing protein n=1 Tax=Clonostachys solani TaxID=160281 RepID=A0A9N9YPV7_9HYPO|nr:unnamed protein product [Clonostachys solani]
MPRARISAACSNCRQKKIKCDGNQPYCGSCLRRKEPRCVYNRGQPSRSKARALLPRPEVSHQENTTLGRANLSNLAKNEEFFGGSSASSFTSQINSAIDARLGRAQPMAPGFNSVWPSRGKGTQPPQDDPDENPLDYTLPRREFADDLLENYYGLVWVIVPMHDWVLFQAAYRYVWLGQPLPIPERIFYCMLNLTFALGSQFSGMIQPRKRRETGRAFWKRAHELFDPRLHDSASVEGVQCLILMGLYLQTTSESHQCWMTVGSAIRMAQSLGLHLHPSPRTSTTRRDGEMARRVWFGCVYMDRSLSMTFGRPSMIADWQCNMKFLPSMIDDDLLDSQVEPSAIRPDGKTTAVAFFIKTLELYKIVNDCLLELYMNSPDKSTKTSHTIVSVLQLDDRLVQWSRSVPDRLRYVPTSSSDAFIFQRQRIVLRARYLYARIVILRPILSEFCLKQARPKWNTVSDSSLNECLVDRCSTLCFEAAHEIIDMIYSHLDRETVTGPVPAWWLAVLFVYTAATVLLAERIMPSDSDTQICTPWPANSSWHRAIEILKAYAKVGESAERCIAALEILLEKIQGQCQIIVRLTQKEASNPDSSIAAPEVSSQSEATQFGDTGPFSSSLVDLEGIDFNVDDMFWLNCSVADILVGT